MAMEYLIDDDGAATVPLIPVGPGSLADVAKDLSAEIAGWVTAAGKVRVEKGSYRWSGGAGPGR